MTTHTVDTVVIGAGHAGLAVSRLLTQHGQEHVVLERGGVGERWRTERWDSLHLLTPSWMTRLPGWYYTGPDPDGYLSASQFLRSLQRYAASFAAPVVGGTSVRSLRAARDGRFALHTDGDTWHARHVVLATGPHGTPHVPAGLARSDLHVVPSNRYRNAEDLPSGGVLVVGASASGTQIADELARAGRDVVLAVGRHTRMPRRYRGMDAFWWLERTGRLARTIDEVADPDVARRETSLQLVGRNQPHPHGSDLDLAALHRRGVLLCGRLQGLDGGAATFAADLPTTVASADRTMHRFLDVVDRHVEEAGLTREVLPARRPTRFTPPPAPTRVPLESQGIRTVVLAAGYRPDHPWVQLPILDRSGAVEQYRGLTRVPGIYVVGQRFQHRRDSGFIDGARHDARTVVAHLSRGVLPESAPRAREESAA
ncbi:flavin-containing monooxygenase [Nocardioides euryhalodurans]|uniref:Pyridine nucleotide-disulfide oxidoreductase n=1 Tax=Nocardioides euryhalodurans TaxID=2518370 RepID=A0A4P7GNR2_9ACTN|nr:NAD(P)/FAD-dependent oxidoreductase [Nocardioides euryhalodurans]QBR93866.1 pyridine nucleotide-disulfide oxidoreductase [Nocardioides euryhalodurans]